MVFEKKHLIFGVLFLVILDSAFALPSCDSSCKAQSFASGTCESPTGGSFVASAELLSYGNSYTDITDSEANTLFSLFQTQGFTEFTMRLPAFSYTSSGATSTQVSNIKRLMHIADEYGLQVNLDLHTWYTTWDNDFRDSASGSAANRVAYIQYVRNTIPQFESEPSLKAWMVLNEPQARTASTSENSFIRDVIREAKNLTSRPVSVRFMMGYSPSTGHYATYLDDEVDFLCRNSYWDARNPSATVYGATQAKFLAALDRAHSQGKELWITEFGKTSDQVDYFKKNVAYYNSVGVDRVFAWAIQTEGTESYNIFNGMTPGAAFYELVSNSTTPTCSGTQNPNGNYECSGICCCSGTVQKCSDGTAYNQCSATKPKYCSSGTLIDKCSTCGCPTSQTCQADGSCKTSTTKFTVGVDYWSGNTKSTFTNNDLPLLKDAGIQMLRIEFSSGSVTNLRTLVPSVVENEINVLGLLLRTDLAPDNVSAWGDWVYNTVNEFKNNVHVWECWNEPNLENFFSGKDPVKYTAFLKKCYEQAKLADPTCKVLGGSVVFTHQTALNFLTAIYQNGAKDYMDRLSYHPYCTPYAPNDTSSPNPYIYLTKVRTVMTNYGDTRPIWITEVGWTTADVGETKQTDYLVKALQMARDWGWVETFIIYNWKDSSTSGSLTKGLLRTDRTLKPSYYAVKDFITGITNKGTIWGANLYVPKFSDSNPSGYAASYLSNTVFQAAKDMGITHIILWQKNFNEAVNGVKPAQTITQAQMVDAVSRMKNYGLQPIIVLDYNVNDAVALVTALGSNCMMYEVCKEPHVTGSSCYADEATYANRWNEVVSACRQVNPNAMYGGPAVGSIPSTSPRSETWMREWLGQCDGDFVSVHSFYDPITTKSDVISRARTDTITDITYLKDMLADYGKQDLPIVFSEVQWTSAQTTNGWDMDQSFNDDFADSLMSTMEEQDIYAATYWVLMGYDNNFAIIRPPSQNYEKKPQYYAIQDYLNGTGETTTTTTLGTTTTSGSTSTSTTMSSTAISTTTFRSIYTTVPPSFRYRRFDQLIYTINQYLRIKQTMG